MLEYKQGKWQSTIIIVGIATLENNSFETILRVIPLIFQHGFGLNFNTEIQRGYSNTLLNLHPRR